MSGRRRRIGCAAGLAAALAAGPAGAPPAAAADPAPDASAVELSLRDTLRWEHWEFFDPAAPGGDPDYDFVANRLRAALRVERGPLAAEAALQYVQLVSLPTDAAGAPGGALGTGALYFGHSEERAPEAVQLEYLNAALRDPFGLGLEAKLGRFGWASGLERDSGVPKLEAVKRSRIAERLVGEFGWSHFQRSFDGAALGWDHPLGRATLAAFRPTEGGFEDGGNRTIDEIGVALAAWTTAPGAPLPGVELQVFALLYDDERRVRARPDNSGRPPPERQDLQIHGFGGHAVGAWRLGPGELDALAWGVVQRGRWLGQDHRAFATALEAGYQWDGLPGRPWLRIGLFRGSGDDAPGDGRHETFFQVLPTARLHALTASYDLMNLTEVFVELRLAPAPGVELRLDVHDLRLSAREDLWYAGAGATQARGTRFGFAGRPSGGRRHLGTVAQLSARWRLTPWAELRGFYGRLFGGGVVRSTFADDDDLDFLYLELELRASAP